MAIEGPLKELSIHDVFQLLDLSKKTGSLRVSSDLRQNDGTVYFEDGVVVGAEVRSNPHPLGRLLIKAGRVNEQDLARARGLQTAGDTRRLGEILGQPALGVTVLRAGVDQHQRAIRLTVVRGGRGHELR